VEERGWKVKPPDDAVTLLTVLIAVLVASSLLTSATITSGKLVVVSPVDVVPVLVVENVPVTAAPSIFGGVFLDTRKLVLAVTLELSETEYLLPAAKTGGVMSTQSVDARRKTRKIVSALWRSSTPFLKTYRLPGPKNAPVLSILDVIRPALIDSMGSQNTPAFVERWSDSEDSRFLTCVRALMRARGMTLPSPSNATMS